MSVPLLCSRSRAPYAGVTHRDTTTFRVQQAFGCLSKPTFPGFGVVVGPRIAPSPVVGNGKSRTACLARVEPIS